MDLQQYSRIDLLRSLEAEAAKALKEVKTTQSDLDKVNGRLRFILAAIHTLKDKEEER